MKAKESDLCKLFIRQVKQLKAWNYYKTDFEIVHIPNERISGKNKFLAYNYNNHLCAMGMLPGVADYIILYHPGKTAAIEFKRDKTCKLQTNQQEFKSRCGDLEMPYLCTYSVDEALEFMKELLG